MVSAAADGRGNGRIQRGRMTCSKIGQIASLMKNLPKMQEEMRQLQDRIASIVCEGDAGGGMVKAESQRPDGSRRLRDLR